ncbi:MFS transporter [Ruficoccus sp. ZRK36]|uniref:MFS transporter n=1 Tax=Ruficoccus sp. ZRK36 TaxID=2866311 RepID=UPI001C734F93|nr:MFS transporter [Ruficoccus sp. ZRK36]QYY35043.1 MFS transporter [Ruficoccus sp. ZRK36]
MTSNGHSSAPVRPGLTLAAALLGFFMITLDAVVVNVALPTMGEDLSADMSGLQWVVDSYTMVFAALLLSAGVISDRIGARGAFGMGVVLFMLSSLVCGLAPDIHTLVAARFVQGAGAAVMMPSSMSLIRHAYHDPVARGRAVAYWALGGSVAATSGPVVGGLLTLLNWRWIFFINLPVCLVTFLFLARAAHSPQRTAPFDLWGQLTAVLTMGALTFGAIEAGEAGLADPRVWGAFIVAACSLGGFVWGQRRARHPMMPPELFRVRNVVISVVVGFTFMFGYFGLPFVMSLYLQQLRGLSALQTGLSFLPMMLIGLVLTPFSARIVERFNPKNVIFWGLVSMALGLLSLVIFTDEVPVWGIAALMGLVGLGGPLIAPPIAAVLLGSVPVTLVGTASGVFNTSRQVGGALAVAIFGALLTQPFGFVNGMRASLVLATIVAVATACLSLRLEHGKRDA